MIIIFCHPNGLVFAQDTYDILHCIDEGMETRAMFLDFSKVFNKVWHKGLICKSR